MSDRRHHKTGDPADRGAVLESLRARIRALEGPGGGPGARRLPFGLPALDAALPEGGLPLGCLHEIAGSATAGDGAATGFAAVLLGRLAARFGPVLWVTGGGDLYAPGLAGFGLSPDRLLVAEARRTVDRLWALEEAARSAALAAVLGEVDSLDLTASRRLQLAAETGGVTVLLLRRRIAAANRGGSTASVAVPRWQVAALPSRPALLDSGRPEPGLGAPRWQLDLVRCRGGQPGGWAVEWRGPATGLVPAEPDRLAGRAVAPVGCRKAKPALPAVLALESPAESPAGKPLRRNG